MERGERKGQNIFAEMTAFSSETVEVRKWWNDTVKGLEKNNYQLRLLYVTKLSFKNECEGSLT